jgi:DNA-binding XRE family transcriptional regulator
MNLPFEAHVRRRLFEKHIDKSPQHRGCWVWTGSRSSEGYGRVFVHIDGQERNILAHRVAYYLEHAEAPVVVRHFVCNNRLCVNPLHLAGGSQWDNMQDREASGHTVRGERHYRAKLSDEEVVHLRRVWNTGQYNQGQLAEMFGIDNTTVAKIVTNKLRYDPDYTNRIDARSFAMQASTDCDVVRRLRIAAPSTRAERNEWATNLGISERTIRDILSRRTWTDCE